MGVKNIYGELRINDDAVATKGWVVRQIEQKDPPIIATFNITKENTEITLQNIKGLTQIDWGDGIIDSELSHTYKNIGEYTSKIYDVTSIGKQAFYNCDSLTSVVIGDSVTSIGSSAFYNCSSLTSVVIGDGVTTIGSSAFYNCSSLTSVVIPDSVTTIGGDAFYNCKNLTSVVIGNGVTTIDSNGAFKFCKNLTNIYIGNSVTKIGQWCFDGCSNLKTITIPDSVTTILINAFDSCTNLTDVVIGSGIETLREDIFENCEKLTRIEFRKLNPPQYYDWFSGVVLPSCKIYVPYGCAEAYKTKWAADGAEQAIIDLIVESDREAMMSDIEALEKLVAGLTDAQITALNNFAKSLVVTEE